MKFKYLAAAATALLFPIAVWAVPVAVTMTPSTQTVAKGDSVTVTVRIDGLLGAADQLSAYDLAVTYDTSKLTFVSQAFLGDAFMGSGAELESFTHAGGIAEDIVDSFFTDPADLVLAQKGVDGFNLFSLTFTAANADTFTNLGFSVVANISPLVLGNSNGNILDATYAGACIGIGSGSCGDVTTPVPEPGTFGLMAMGLLVAGAYGRRAKRGSKATLLTA